MEITKLSEPGRLVEVGRHIFPGKPAATVTLPMITDHLALMPGRVTAEGPEA